MVIHSESIRFQSSTDARPHIATRILSVVCTIGESEAELVGRLTFLHDELSRLNMPVELVVVLNGCDNKTIETVRNTTFIAERMQVYVVARCVDRATALMAGLDNCIGDWIATIDIETDEFTVIGRLLDCALTERVEVALGSSPDPSRRPLDAAMSIVFHLCFRFLHGFDLAIEAPTARLMSRSVLNAVLRDDSPLVAFETLTARQHYRRRLVPYARHAASRRSVLERVLVRWRTLIGINAVPLRLANLLCGIGAVAAWLYSAYVIAVFLLRDDVIPGWTTLSLMVSGMFILLSLVLWLLSEYILMLLDPGSRKPRYEIADEFGGQIRPIDNRLNVETDL